MREYTVYAHASLPTMVIVVHPKEGSFLVPRTPGGWKDRKPYQGYTESLRRLDPEDAAHLLERLGLGQGGYRKESGRPPLIDGEKLPKKTVTISEEDIAYLSKLGGGNLSAGIREAVRRLQNKHD